MSLIALDKFKMSGGSDAVKHGLALAVATGAVVASSESAVAQSTNGTASAAIAQMESDLGAANTMISNIAIPLAVTTVSFGIVALLIKRIVYS